MAGVSLHGRPHLLTTRCLFLAGRCARFCGTWLGYLRWSRSRHNSHTAPDSAAECGTSRAAFSAFSVGDSSQRLSSPPFAAAANQCISGLWSDLCRARVCALAQHLLPSARDLSAVRVTCQQPTSNQHVTVNASLLRKWQPVLDQCHRTTQMHLHASAFLAVFPARLCAQ